MSLWAWVNPCQPASPLPHVPKEAAPFCTAEFPAPAVTWAKGKRENSRLHIGSRCGPLPALSGNLIKFPRQPGEVLNDQISQLTPLAAMGPLCLPDGWRRVLPALSQLANRAGYKGLVFPGANARNPSSCPSFLSPVRGPSPLAGSWQARSGHALLSSQRCQQASLLSSVPPSPPGPLPPGMPGLEAK